MPGNVASWWQSRQSGIVFGVLLSIGSPLAWWTSSGTPERAHLVKPRISARNRIIGPLTQFGLRISFTRLRHLHDLQPRQ
jgi:hypothetical protein